MFCIFPGVDLGNTLTCCNSVFDAPLVVLQGFLATVADPIPSLAWGLLLSLVEGFEKHRPQEF